MKTSKNTLKNWFKTGDYPTQEHFWNWMDSYWHKDEPISIEAVADLLNILNSKATTQQTDSLQQQINNLNLEADLEIGKPVDNSTPKAMLFVDESGKLGEITNFQYDEVEGSLSFLNGDNIGLLLNSEVEVDDGVFLNLNGIAKMVDGAEAFVGIMDLSIIDPTFGVGVLITSDQQVLITSD
ncbi:MAG: hypothetical protein LC105_06210, partial [Chitinophagales bacterium]|nr:hypothetical protein [Chitinophagales bacterium]